MSDEVPNMRVSPSVLPEGSGLELPPVVATSPRPELVLLVEDDELVGDVVEQILGRMVNRVIRARNGTEAAQLFAENESKISLVMLDCCLPDVDGVALCRVLRRIAPKLPIILTSGWDHEGTRAM